MLAHKELDGVPHLEVIAIYNAEMPTLIGKISYIKDAYLVPKEDIQIDFTLQEKKEEEVLKEDVNISIPITQERKEKKPAIKKPEQPTPLIEISAGDIVHRNVGDALYEVIGMARKDNDLVAECRLIESSRMPGNIGNVYFFKEFYLCEEKVAIAA